MWHVFATSALGGGWRQEDEEFTVIFGYIAKSGQPGLHRIPHPHPRRPNNDLALRYWVCVREKRGSESSSDPLKVAQRFSLEPNFKPGSSMCVTDVPEKGDIRHADVCGSLSFTPSVFRAQEVALPPEVGARHSSLLR